MVDGGTDKSYGIYVAKMAGLPNEIILRANEILGSLTKDEKQVTMIEDYNSDRLKQSLKNNILNELTNELKSISIDEMSPLEALSKINELKTKYEL